MTVDMNTLLIAGVMAASNIGSLAWLAKKYLGSVDDHNKIIPQIAGALQSFTDTQREMKDQMVELFESRREHSEDLREIKTVQRLKGCYEHERRETH